MKTMKSSSRLVTLFVKKVVFAATLLFLSLKSWIEGFDSIISDRPSQVCEAEYDQYLAEKSKDDDHDNHDNEDFLLGDNGDGYEGDNEDDDAGCDDDDVMSSSSEDIDEGIEDFNRRCDEMIAKQKKQWKEELFNDHEMYAYFLSLRDHKTGT